MNLDTLLQRADIWRGGDRSPRDAGQHNIHTGYATLDAQLPGNGWPLGALIELLCAHHGIGELQLLMPALARLSQQGRWLAWVAPPHLPYAPALAAAEIELSRTLLIRPAQTRDSLWAMEQALRSGVCGAVLGWLIEPASRILRRLQLAAEDGDAMGVLFRPLQAGKQPSPAALRLQLMPAPGGITLHILKRRGSWATRPFVLHRHHDALA